jgi:hypothetical protein
VNGGDDRFHDVRRTRVEACTALSPGVCRLDTKHARPFVVAEIAHCLGFGNPGIPNDGCVGTAFPDGYLAAIRCIVNRAFRPRVEINTIRLAGEPQRLFGLSLPLKAIVLSMKSVPASPVTLTSRTSLTAK